MIGARVLDALGRLGGAMFTPHRTLPALVARPRGSVLEVVAVAVLAGTITSPTRVGLALLLVRASVPEGLLALVDALFSRFSAALVGALVGAAVLTVVARARGVADRVSFDRALDLCGYALVPYFALAVVGATLSNLGLELRWLPHRALRGAPLDWLIGVIAGYAWSVVAFAMLLRGVWRVARTGGPAT